MPGRHQVVCALAIAWLSALLLIAPHPAHAQSETVLYNFTGGSDGGSPQSNLTFHGGNFYGTTIGGGSGDGGTVFELSPNGSGGWNETVIYNFCSEGGANCTDGANPSGPVVFDSAGNLYGTTVQGGNSCPPYDSGCGVVFELSPGEPNWKETVLYAFCPDGFPCDAGFFPGGDVVIDATGNLYGTDQAGVFEVSPSDGGWTFQIISYNVINTAPGLTMDSGGNLYAAAPGTGQWTIFEISPDGKNWQTTSPYVFPKGTGGSYPIWSPLALDPAGNLYGTWTAWYRLDTKPIEFGGIVYKLTKGSGGWTKKNIFSFKPSDSESEGNGPSGGVIFDAAGNVYGTTIQGGTNGQGTVYELLAPVGSGSYEEKVLWNFNGTDGASPRASLYLDSSGNLYGTTPVGGSSGNGVVFELTGVPATTITTLTSSPNPSTSGQVVTFTASISSIRGTPPNGETISFEEGTTALGTGTLSGGSASFTTSTLALGTDAIKAVYAGDSKFYGSTSNTVKQVVKK